MSNVKNNSTEVEELTDDQLQDAQGGGTSIGAFKAVDGLSSETNLKRSHGDVAPVENLTINFEKVE